LQEAEEKDGDEEAASIEVAERVRSHEASSSSQVQLITYHSCLNKI
jgi:hypothetical protein